MYSKQDKRVFTNHHVSMVLMRSTFDTFKILVVHVNDLLFCAILVNSSSY